MDVNTSQAAVISANTDVSAAKSQSRTSENVKSSGKSFDEEMKSAAKTEETKDSSNNEKAENAKTSEKDTKTTNKEHKNETPTNKEPNEIISPETLSGEINFTDFKYHNESQAILSQNIQSLLDTKDLMSTISSATTFEYDAISMSDADANFFANLVQKTDMSMKNIMNELSSEIVENSKNIQQNLRVSSVLMEKLSESLKTNKPFRIDFDKDVSVIIRVNKDGSLAANFIPGDKAVEQYLKNNIASLRQRFDEENLSYSELTYSNSKNGQQQRRKKENNDE